MVKDIAIVYLVAGMSSRFGGKVKQFAEIGPNNETLIEYSLNQAIEAGFDKIIFIVGDKTENGFKKMFGTKYKGVPIFYVKQDFDSKVRDKPWGTVDALCCAKKVIDCPFVVCNGDEIYGKNSFKIVLDSLKNNINATIGFKLGDMLSNNCSVNRGIFDISKDGYVRSLTEVFDIEKSNLKEKDLDINCFCNVNLFGFSPNILNMLDNKLKDFKKKHSRNKKTECLLSTELSKLIKKKLIKIKICSTPDKWMGITGPGDVDIVKKTILSQLV
jgi:NDP-sugar pyrophosphorylase family protein